jgi:hypothetical protein
MQGPDFYDLKIFKKWPKGERERTLRFHIIHISENIWSKIPKNGHKWQEIPLKVQKITPKMKKNILNLKISKNDKKFTFL